MQILLVVIFGIIKLFIARAGYEEMVLDTLKPMKAAIHLYERAGFRECPPYYHNPMEDVLYFRKELKR